MKGWEDPEDTEDPEEPEDPEDPEFLRALLRHPTHKHPHAGTTSARSLSTTTRRIVSTPTVARRYDERCSRKNPPRGRRDGPSTTIRGET